MGRIANVVEAVKDVQRVSPADMLDLRVEQGKAVYNAQELKMAREIYF